MENIFERKFSQWTHGKDPVQARVSVFEHIRDIPYAVIPELNSPQRYIEILDYGRGSCMPKHLILGNMLERLGLPVLYAVYPFRWGDEGIGYPPGLRRLAEELPISHHLACRLVIGEKLVLVDATLDPALEGLGLPVNRRWDGFSDTFLPISPCGEEQLYHPSEACLSHARHYDDREMRFYDKLNRWLDESRKTYQLS